MEHTAAELAEMPAEEQIRYHRSTIEELKPRYRRLMDTDQFAAAGSVERDLYHHGIRATVLERQLEAASEY